jgi:hypothetical protein
MFIVFLQKKEKESFGAWSFQIKYNLVVPHCLLDISHLLLLIGYAWELQGRSRGGLMLQKTTKFHCENQKN